MYIIGCLASALSQLLTWSNHEPNMTRRGERHNYEEQIFLASSVKLFGNISNDWLQFMDFIPYSPFDFSVLEQGPE